MRSLAPPLTVLLAAMASSHMQLYHPPPFNGTNNPHRTTPPDPYLQYPYDCCGPNDRWTTPCRGYHSLLGTSQGQPTATWEAGSRQNWTITGIGNHWGGSCQVGFSVDHGKTFRVASSYEGNCPHREGGLGPKGQEFGFTVPADLECGVRIFAWVWYNREQEFNMNCAAVNVTRGSSGHGKTVAKSKPQYSKRAHGHRHIPHYRHRTPFTKRPIMLIADDGDGCTTPKTTAELKYPHPGPAVVPGDGVYPLELPKGDCSSSGKQSYHGESGEDGHPR